MIEVLLVITLENYSMVLIKTTNNLIGPNRQIFFSLLQYLYDKLA